ncbi:MAG: hypothetical protein Q8R16_05565, partial [bacterium]|nr:hypothetical protein [bacterium]
PFLTALELGESLNVDTVTVKAKTEYILRTLLEYANRGAYSNERYHVDVEGVAESNIITLRSTAPEEDSTTILGIHQSAVDKLLEDHDAVADRIRRELEREKLEAELGRDVARSALERFPARMRDLAEGERLDRERLGELSAFVEASRSNRTQVLLSESSRDPRNPSFATTLLLIDVEIEAIVEKIEAIRKRLAVEFPKERRVLEEERKTHEQSIARLGRDLQNLQHRIDTINRTKVIIPPSRLLRSNSMLSLNTALGVAVPAGLFVGAVMAFFIEFVRNAHKLRREER